MAAVLGPTLDPHVQRPPAATGLAVFDLDRTMIPGSSLAIFGRELLASGIIARRDLARFSLTELSFRRGVATDATLERLCRSLLALAAGRSLEPLVEAARRVAPQIAAKSYGVARLLLDGHRRGGDMTVLLSAAPHDLVAEVARVLCFDMAIGTEVEVVDGRLTGRLASTFCYGEGKVHRLRDTPRRRRRAHRCRLRRLRVRPCPARGGGSAGGGEPRSPSVGRSGRGELADRPLQLISPSRSRSPSFSGSFSAQRRAYQPKTPGDREGSRCQCIHGAARLGEHGCARTADLSQGSRGRCRSGRRRSAGRRARIALAGRPRGRR
ncbi:MAG TPA: HAD-IB family hydrolase [Acidimicrobiales bacterium]|jgi:HAD superfamily hydrolase (TIGR01490 family)|nr:HAD-IB family hydrolase [Acidimicrobiales bacterium]